MIRLEPLNLQDFAFTQAQPREEADIRTEFERFESDAVILWVPP